MSNSALEAQAEVPSKRGEVRAPRSALSRGDVRQPAAASIHGGTAGRVMRADHPAIAEAEQVVRDHRDRLKAVMLMQVRLFKWDLELLDDERPEIVAMVANNYLTQLKLYRQTWGESQT